VNTPYWLEIKESKPKESKMNEDNYDKHRITGMWWSGDGMHKGLSSNKGFLDIPFLTADQRKQMQGAVLQLKKSSNPAVQYDCFLMIPKQQPQSTEEEISFMQVEMFKQGQTLRALESSVSKMCQDIQAMCRRELDRDIKATTKGEQPNV